jgi:hypothetical protein
MFIASFPKLLLSFFYEQVGIRGQLVFIIIHEINIDIDLFGAFGP